MKLPNMYGIRQQFHSESIKDVEAAVYQQLGRLNVGTEVRAGQRVAIAVGSRGIHNLVTIVAKVVEYFKTMDLRPLIIPAMGSHGGAKAEGQTRVLHELGITESTVAAPIVSNMDVVSLGHLDSGAEVFFAKDAFEVDHLVVISRVKPHTDFHGEVESGLCKMLAVGCGRQKGASNIHRFGLAASFVPAAQLILEKAPVLCGLAIVENASGGTHKVKLALPHEFVHTDKELLKEARRLLPRIPLADLDILVVDEMGKNISGAGIDTNVIGLWRREGGPREPDYRIIIVLDLTDKSHGNATGIGVVDLTTRRVINKIDPQVTYTNAITSGVLNSARLPIALENDKTVLETALSQFPYLERVRMVRITNSLSLEIFWATQAVLPELREQEGITIDDKLLQPKFDKEGRLLSFVN